MGEKTCSQCGRSMTVRDLDDIGTCTTCLAPACIAHPAYLETVDRPAVLVSKDHAILRSNRVFREAFGRVSGVDGTTRIGEALDCGHLAGSQRCGETAYCLQCGLRRVIGLVYISGERLRRIPVHHVRKPGHRETLEITAAKTGEFVLLLL